MSNALETSTTLSPARKTIVGIQFLFVAFGATVLVPLLVGLDPATALFTAGLGTFIFHLITKGKVPIFLGSSFAFIAPIISASQQWGMPGTLAGMAGVALVYFIMSALIKWQGKRFLDRLFPPVVIGPVIIIIGLSLSPSAVDMAKENWLLAGISLLTAILVLVLGRGLIKLVPVVCGIVVGYIVSVCMGLVDFSAVSSAPWFALPSSITHFRLPQFAWEPFLFMIPVAIAPVIEHIGDVYVVSAVAGKDFVKNPGLHRTMLGDGLACLVASFFGGPPVTTYSEVTGAMQITRITSPAVIRIAAGTAIVFPATEHPRRRFGRHHAHAVRLHCCGGHPEPGEQQGGPEPDAQRHHRERGVDTGHRRRYHPDGLVLVERHRPVGPGWRHP